MKSNMTIPSRPAPAPPATQNSNTRFSSQQASRYTPTTNWDDSPFDAGMQQPTFNRVKKPPPPRPPPPKISQSTSLPALKKPAQSVNILSNLFGSSKSKQSTTNANTGSNNNQRGSRLQNLIQPKVPPKLPAPPPTNHHHHNRYQAIGGAAQPQSAQSPHQQTENVVQLISFDSPPDSPTLTQKSSANSDCVSIDSFSSDSNYSSPHNESATTSQAESGFEDDFSVQSLRSNSGGGGFKAWEVSDPFSQPPVQPVKAPKPQCPMPKSVSVGGSSFFSTFDSGRSSAASRHQTDEFLDPLCNGKTLIKTTPVITRPTIIKPKILTSKPGAGVRPQAAGKNVSNYAILSETFAIDNNLDDTSLPALPMPNIPPPPPPVEYLQSLEDLNLNSLNDEYEIEDEENESYGITLYDFSSDQMDDLNFKANEKVYIVRQINEEWLFGRDKRGCEGMFPANFIDIKIPIKSEPGRQQSTSVPATLNPTKQSSINNKPVVRVLYDFNAETLEDLTIRENEMVTVFYQVNAEWLYGQNSSRQLGQFPANFIEYVPKNLPQMP